MSKYFRPWNIDQTLLLPPNVQDFVPKGHVSRFIVELVRESLDLKEIMGSYVSGLGQPPFDPRMMVALLLHGYASGLYSSRRIAKACRERNDFVMIVALDPPDFRTISDFRKRHLKALGALFLQVLKLCETAGLVKLGHVALDGTKIKANASKHKAMSYERMKKREAELKAEVARMLAAAEAADSEEDETFGQGEHGDEDAGLGRRQAETTGENPAGDGGFETPYRLRKQVVEPVFGQIKQARGFRQFLLRGVEKVRAEWAMICTTHNLLKLSTLANAASVS